MSSEISTAIARVILAEGDWMKTIRLVSIREVMVGWWWSRRCVGYQAVLTSGVFVHQSDVLDTALEATADGVQGLLGDLRDDAMVCSEDFEAHGPRLTSSPTARGFDRLEFREFNGHACSLQVSSSMEEPKIWLGIDDAAPEIMKSKAQRLGWELPPGEVSGWMPVPFDKDVLFHTRMHLDRATTIELIAKLNRWVHDETLT